LIRTISKKESKDKEIDKKSKPDFLIFFTILLLNILGLIFVLSSSLPQGQRFFRQNLISSPYIFFYNQLRSFFAGLVVFFLGFIVPIKILRKLSIYLVTFTIISLLIVAFIPYLSIEYGGARRWLDLKIFTFQPSEMAKISIILYLADLFDSKKNKIKSFSFGFIPFIIILLIFSLLLIKQPDLGTLSLIALVSVIMFFVAGADPLHLLLMGLAGSLSLWYTIQFAPYRMSRITVWLNPQDDPTGEGYQLNQSLLAIGTGGLWGRGIGQSRQATYLPEAFTDSIFAIIAEELGFVKASLFISIFLILLFRGIQIARKSKSVFIKLSSVGITSWIVLQAFLNISAISGILPLTGVPLPFISYGGSSLATLMFASGLLFNLSQYTSSDS